MTESALNRIVASPPPPGHRIDFVRAGASQSIDLRRLYDLAGQLAAGLTGLGVEPGDRIGILAANSAEWVLLDLAALRLGVQTAGFESGRFTADPALLTRYNLKLLFTDQPSTADGIMPMSLAMELASERGAMPVPPPVSYRTSDVTTIKFTSGSTGEPKGLGATAGSIDGSLRAVQGMFAHGPGDNLFVFLPLSLLQQRYWVYSALRYGHDVTISTFEAAHGALRRYEPTVVMGVPAFYEVMRKRIEARAEQRSIEPRDAARQLFGTRIRYLWTGSAPANPAVLKFFTNLGMPIYEGYGLNETCIVTKNYPGACKLGSVGRPVPGKHVLIDDDGVVSVRSDFPVNVRYEYAAPGDSERVFGKDGVVRTGDLGYFDEDGFLYIVGRADDVIVLGNGKNLITRPIEEYMKLSAAVSECVLYSVGRTHLAAVVSPSAGPSEAAGSGEAAGPADEAAIAEQVARTNAKFAPDVTITKVVVARERFSVANGMLTSQFKPKRNAILKAYHAEIYERSGV